MDDPTAFLHRSMPLCETLGVRARTLSPEVCELELDWDARLCTTAGLLHGGALMSLADSSGAACAFFNLPEGASTSTIESKTSFFGAVREGTVTAAARPLHVGGTTIAVEVEVRDAGGRLVGKTTQTQLVLRPSGK